MHRVYNFVSCCLNYQAQTFLQEVLHIFPVHQDIVTCAMHVGHLKKEVELEL
jgi:hypothetical protein